MTATPSFIFHRQAGWSLNENFGSHHKEKEMPEWYTQTRQLFSRIVGRFSAGQSQTNHGWRCLCSLYKLRCICPCLLRVPLGWLYRSTHVQQNSSFDAYVISNDVRSCPLVHSAKGRRRQITERNKKDCHTLFMCSCCCCCIWDSLLFQRVENPTGGKLSRLHPIYIINETNWENRWDGHATTS